MAFLSRLFRRGDPLVEREEARRQGMRDARQHPLGEFTDPDFQPAYVTEIRARAREQITEVDRRLAATRTALLERALGAREVILRELGRSDTRPEPPAYVNGHAPDPGRDRPPDAFISIAEARARRTEARRRQVVEAADAKVQQARARLEQLTQEWESALIERDHEVEAVHARAEQLIAAYKGGVLQSHPRREEVPALWKGEVIAMEPTDDTATAISGREEIGRILREAEDRIEVWRAEIMPRELPHELHRPLSPAPTDPPGHRSPDPPHDRFPDAPDDRSPDASDDRPIAASDHRPADTPDGRPADTPDGRSADTPDGRSAAGNQPVAGEADPGRGDASTSADDRTTNDIPAPTPDPTDPRQEGV